MPILLKVRERLGSMTDLFDLIGYNPPEIPFENTEGKFAPDDPAYITPPLKEKTVTAIAPDEPQILDDDKSDKTLEIFAEYLETAIAMSNAKNPSEASEIRKELIRSRVQFAFWVCGDSYQGQTEKIHTLMGQLTNELFYRQCELMKLRESPTAIAPQHSAIEEEIPTKTEHPTPSNSPETLKGGYIEEKQIKKNGKIIGTYLYERYRENGKLKSKYLGKKTGTFARSP